MHSLRNYYIDTATRYSSPAQVRIEERSNNRKRLKILLFRRGNLKIEIGDVS